MKRFLLLLFCLLIFPVLSPYAQEGEETGQVTREVSIEENQKSDNEESTEEDKSETDYIEMDIRTSTLMELAVWCRELGLSDGGTREDLAARLRAHYNIARRSSISEEQRIITIESAKTTEYFTLEAVDEEYARLKGDVIISLKDGNSVHRIKAWEILYNRTRNVMTASGKVEYVKEEGDTIETFKGDTITVNLDNWSSIFMDGVSEKSMSGKITAYRFAGTIISRNSEDVTVLTGAEITNPNSEEPYWSLHASKLWLLPGNDFALLNAVLKVGHIPVFYFPFFYYPADEIVFHPVLGYRSREGTYLQTTTYILGRPRTSVATENSITKIFGNASDNMEQKREGIFLRHTGEKKTDPGDTRLSLLFDAYVNMGVYLGTEFTMPRKGPFGETNISAGLGRTRNIYPMDTANTPFPKYDGVSEWNNAMFFSQEEPFRYRFKLDGSLNIKNGSLSWVLPYYSDPYVDRDFMNRTEIKDWFSILMDYVKGEEEETTDTTLSSYEWRVSGSFNPTITSYNPYIQSLSVSNISSSLLFNNRNSKEYGERAFDPNYNYPLSPPNPGRAFFFPSRFTMYSVSVNVGGTPWTLRPGSVPGFGTEQVIDGPAPGDSLLPDIPRSPWENVYQEIENQEAMGQGLYNFSPPPLSQNFVLPSTGGPQFSINYRLTPTTASELQFNSNNWDEQENIDWGDISTILSRFRTDGSLGFNVTHTAGGAYSASFQLTGTGAWQDYLLLNEDAAEFAGAGGTPDEARIKAARDRAYRETYFTSSYNMTTTVRPFFQNDIWGNSNVQYNVKGLLTKTDVDTTGDKPQWDWVAGKWDKKDLETHQVTTNIAANIMDYNQLLSLSAVLPPKDPVASGNATLRAWISETSARTRILEPWDSDLRTFEPVYVTETLRFGTVGSFQQYVVFDPEMKEYTTFTSTLSLSGFSAAYSAVYAQQYKYNYNGSVDNSRPNGWLLDGDKGLYPQSLRFTYIGTLARSNLWGKRLSFSTGVNSNLNFDLQRYTNSRLSMGLNFTFGIANFVNLSFATSSENNVVFRYFQHLPFFNLPVELYQEQEHNFMTDLINSFRFDNEALRRSSGFKMKALNISLLHFLGDWNAKLTVTMTPFLPPGSQAYRFSNEISFLVQWVPIGEIKNQIDYKNEKLTIK